MADYQWPWEYNFPPFFTVQPHVKTKEHQLMIWKSLVLSYQKHNRQAVLNINEDSELFENKSISRKLSPEGRLWVMEELSKSGNASPVDKRKQQWEVYWHTLEEWSALVYDWVVANGMTNTVCTIYELVSGDTSIGEEFHSLDQEVFKKVLKLLEARGKCEIIAFEDNEGVKFF
ncbi:vacuolar protein-sorting-associated protein 25 [Malaya genurostris]|uniref:vacuolar protein-sorting-associated protein 25 n=1 Tax=Malaya genurostris TaxID=325434 RepID=UPI0026F3D09D|nr:vacuolar protein-sorting-associated protein 25 [Malaya genurostris]